MIQLYVKKTEPHYIPGHYNLAYHPFAGRMRKRESNPIAPWNIFPPAKTNISKC